MIRAGRVAATGSRERFTLDPGLSRAVREVFVRLYEKGLIYRGEYMVNWCPRCQTALSRPRSGARGSAGQPLAHPLSGDRHRTRIVVVATTRPETMLGDTAVAVNPSDERYHASARQDRAAAADGSRDSRSSSTIWPIREFGTGVVKVTPAHDPNDFEAGKRHNLPQDPGDRRDAAR